jgi:twitching motility two-component system response regulator PilH
MITSKSKDKDRKWGIEQGADDYITKPFDADDLLDVIERFVRGRIGTES